MNKALENYRFDDAANVIYQFFWGSFCDWYLEIVKLRLDFSETADKAQTKAALTTLVSVFEAALRLLSPFMPFLTEELWHAVYDGNPPAKSIALTRYPQAAVGARRRSPRSDGAPAEPHRRGACACARRSASKKRARSDRSANGRGHAGKIAGNATMVERLARVSEIRFVMAISAGLAKHSTPEFDVAVIYERTIDVAAEREKLSKEIAGTQKAHR